MAKKKTENLDLSKKHLYQELHVNQNPKKGIQGGIFLIYKRKAYNMDGTPVAPGKIWICQECGDMAFCELDFAKHMVKVHPEKAKPKTAKKKGK